MKKYIAPACTAYEYQAEQLLSTSPGSIVVKPGDGNVIDTEEGFLSNEKESPYDSFDWE